MIAFVRNVDRAGLRAPVPTCPGWKVRHLVAHQGMVHRWASAHLRGEQPDTLTDWRVGMNVDDPVRWLREGALELATTIVEAPEQRVAPMFLADSPRPREGWARRQCHETTVHAVDALAAVLGRAPVEAETDWIDREIALDGIDELLTGFLVRPSMALTSSEPLRFVVTPDDADSGWLFEVGAQGAATTRLNGAAPAAIEGDAVLRGTAVSAYLGLWNRSGHPLPQGWEGWAERAGVTWD